MTALPLPIVACAHKTMTALPLPIVACAHKTMTALPLPIVVCAHKMSTLFFCYLQLTFQLRALTDEPRSPGSTNYDVNCYRQHTLSVFHDNSILLCHQRSCGVDFHRAGAGCCHCSVLVATDKTHAPASSYLLVRFLSKGLVGT